MAVKVIKRSIVAFSVLCVVVILSGCSTQSVAAPRQRPVLGWLEKVYVSPGNIVLHAKLDTGADNCSLHAENIKMFKKDDSQWVRFDLMNRYGDKRRIEQKVYRTARIKMKDGNIQRRPVIKLGLCLGTRFEIVEFSLVDRSHFAYPVLVGRNFLSGSVLVDSSDTYKSVPYCESVPL